MAIDINTRITCDSCTVVFSQDGAADKVLAAAQNNGWIMRNGRDYCCLMCARAAKTCQEVLRDYDAYTEARGGPGA